MTAGDCHFGDFSIFEMCNPPVFLHASQESLENAGLLSAMDIVLNHCAGHVNLLVQCCEKNVHAGNSVVLPYVFCMHFEEVHLGFWNSQSLHIMWLGFPKPWLVQSILMISSPWTSIN